MKVTLLYKDREWGAEKSYFDKDEICRDLNLDILFKTAGSFCDEDEEGKSVKVARERDNYVVEMTKRVMMVPLLTPEEVYYRQRMVKEAVESYDWIEELYQTAKNAGEEVARFTADKKKHGYGSGTDQGRQYIASIAYLERIVHYLGRMENIFRSRKEAFITKEMKNFAETFLREYNPEYKECLEKVVKDIRSSMTDGIMEIAAALGPGLSMTELALCDIREPEVVKTGFFRGAAGKIGGFCRSLFVNEEKTMDGENQNLLQDVSEIKNVVLGAMMRYFEPFLKEKETFFKQMHLQTAFLMGAANLYQRVHRVGVDFCFPQVADRKDFCFKGLTEISLAIYNLRCPVDNALFAKEKHLVIVTGANQGGKSTFLRSIGIAQVMLQCGMYVPAKSFESGLYRNIFTHFTRREDSAMNSGRLDEELGRMERIIDHLTKDSVLFLNESFATTTEKEGSIIAGDITRALYERGVRVMMVTHLMAFARNCYEKRPEHALFLSAERQEDGTRTFRMIEQEPEFTSYGLDLYDTLIDVAAPETE